MAHTMDRLLTVAELAAREHVTPRTVRRWRTAGTGPQWIKTSGRILYPLPEVLAWEKAFTGGHSYNNQATATQP